MGTNPTYKRDLDLEKEHFFSLSKDEQFESLIGFLKEAYQNVPKELKHINMELLLEISRCPNVHASKNNPGVKHPCSKIVMSQSANNLSEYQVPEPWSGHIGKAPILFISSNPSISEVEDYPRWSWSDDLIADFFENRFGGGQKQWIIDGKKGLKLIGKHSRATPFWAAVRQRAIELYEREVVPGEDYTLTEVVHCKSRNEEGVREALEECANLYINGVLSLSGAKILVILGKIAGDFFRREYDIPNDKLSLAPMKIGKGERIITFLPHPNAFGTRTFPKVLSASELQRVREYLKVELHDS